MLVDCWGFKQEHETNMTGSRFFLIDGVDLLIRSC